VRREVNGVGRLARGLAAFAAQSSCRVRALEPPWRGDSQRSASTPPLSPSRRRPYAASCQVRDEGPVGVGARGSAPRPRFPLTRYGGPRTRRGGPYAHRSMFAAVGSHSDGPRVAKNFKNRMGSLAAKNSPTDAVTTADISLTVRAYDHAGLGSPPPKHFGYRARRRCSPTRRCSFPPPRKYRPVAVPRARLAPERPRAAS